MESPAMQAASDSRGPNPEPLADSPLCDRCRALRLDDIARLQLAKENLSDTIWDQDRPHTYAVNWWKEIQPGTTCQLCRIIFAANSEWGVMPKIGAHSAQTLFRSQDIADSILFELYAHTTTMLVPHGEQLPGITGRKIDHCQIDYGLLRQWVQDCIQNHGVSCAGADLLPGLKVIDCNTRKIIVLPPDSPGYVALSYRWGTVTNTDTTWRPDDALDNDIPQTVKDAIVVATKVGIPYLWVDKYCIDQANAVEKHNVIRNMDSIYSGAALTIVAAAGDDSNFGLPGVSRLRYAQESIILGGRRFLVFPDSTEEVRRSIWATRAWTYQEGLLSKRRLVFTASQAYFQCMKSYHWEALDAPSETTRDFGFYRVFPEDGIGREPRDIVRRLNEYAARQLSFESDTLNAILGIFQPYQARKVYHLWGVPFLAESDRLERNFALALGWSTRVPGNAKRQTGFPTWSWVGWANSDNLTVPWGPDSLVFGPPERLPSIHVFEGSAVGSRRIPLSEYVLRVEGGADFALFSQSILATGMASRCQVLSPWKVSVELPWKRGEAAFVVRMMGIPEDRYGEQDGDKYVEVLSRTQCILYIGCQSGSNLVFSFLILSQTVARRDRYTRDGTLTVTVPWPHNIDWLGSWTENPSNEQSSAQDVRFRGRKGQASPQRMPIDYIAQIIKFFEEKWEVEEFMLS